MAETFPEKILLVDDVRLFLELEKTFLRRVVCEILTASSGEEALEVLRLERPALIVLDDQMPGIGGLETCRRIKSDPDLRSTIVLMASSPGLEPACWDAGADGFVAKPIVQQGFIERIRSFLPALQLRRNERAFVRLEVEAWIGDSVIRTSSRDLSTTGIFIKTDHPAFPGQSVKLRFNLPGAAAPIEARGEVRNRILPEGETRLSPGFGVLFRDLGEEERRSIEEYIRRLEGGGEDEEDASDR